MTYTYPSLLVPLIQVNGRRVYAKPRRSPVPALPPSQTQPINPPGKEFVLPVDVLCHIFSHLAYDPNNEGYLSWQLEDLKNFSQVCRVFREAALMSSEAWSQALDLHQTSPRFFDLALERTRNANLYVESFFINYDHFNPPTFYTPQWQSLLPRIDRFKILKLIFQTSVHLGPLEEALCQPAPVLESLFLSWEDPRRRVFLTRESMMNLHVPPDALFGGSAPLLKSLHLSDFTLPGLNSPAFANLVTFYFTLTDGFDTSKTTFWRDGLSCMPLLEDLWISGANIMDDRGPELRQFTHPMIDLPHLRRLHVDGLVPGVAIVLGSLNFPTSCSVSLKGLAIVESHCSLSREEHRRLARIWSAGDPCSDLTIQLDNKQLAVISAHGRRSVELKIKLGLDSGRSKYQGIMFLEKISKQEAFRNLGRARDLGLEVDFDVDLEEHMMWKDVMARALANFFACFSAVEELSVTPATLSSLRKVVFSQLWSSTGTPEDKNLFQEGSILFPSLKKLRVLATRDEETEANSVRYRLWRKSQKKPPITTCFKE